jgi:holo-[acyl-carrier protein] synthase
VSSRSTLRVGIDLVQVSRVAESLALFGDRFMRRIFSEAEISYAMSAPAQTAERLAARFAAKEAVIKALRIVDRGVAWRDIEVCRTGSGACEIALRGETGEVAASQGAGALAVSLSHEGDYAAAIVVTHVRENKES